MPGAPPLSAAEGWVTDRWTGTPSPNGARVNTRGRKPTGRNAKQTKSRRGERGGRGLIACLESGNRSLRRHRVPVGPRPAARHDLDRHVLSWVRMRSSRTADTSVPGVRPRVRLRRFSHIFDPNAHTGETAAPVVSQSPKAVDQTAHRGHTRVDADRTGNSSPSGAGLFVPSNGVPESVCEWLAVRAAGEPRRPRGHQSPLQGLVRSESEPSD